MLIQRATLLDGRAADIRLDHVVVEVAEQLTARPGEDVLDAQGGLVLPGLHDHHVHLRAGAAAYASVRVGPPQVRTRADLAGVLARATPDDDGWVRGVGYHDSVAGPLTRSLLDSLHPERPVRVQHRSGALWVLNSSALTRIGLPDHEDGRLLRADGVGRWPTREPDLAALSTRLLSYGVTGLTEATPGHGRSDIESLATAARTGVVRQGLHCMVAPGVPAVDGVSLGPAKTILDDHTLDLESLTDWVAGCHRDDHPVAVHCVTDSQLVVTIAALRAVGAHPRDRIEHAAVVPADCIGDVKALGVTVVTQPNFVAERGDEYLADVPAEQLPELWRLRSLLEAGIKVALSTDMPFGDADPWAAMRAAVCRKTPSGVTLSDGERISPRAALSMFLGHAADPANLRTVAAGQPGDLIVLATGPAETLDSLTADAVVATVLGGSVAQSVG